MFSYNKAPQFDFLAQNSFQLSTMMEMNSQYQDEETEPVLSSMIYKRLYDISIITYYLMKDVKKEMTREMHSKIVELFFDHFLTQQVIEDSEQPILSTDKRTLISSIFNALKLEESSGKIHYPGTDSRSTNETSQQQKPATLKEVSFEVRFAKFVTLCNGLQDGKKVEYRFNDANEGKDTVFMEDALLIDPIIQMIKKEDFSQLTSEQVEIIRKLESKGFLPYSKNQTVLQSSSETNSNMESQLKPIIMRRKNKRKLSTEYEEKWFKRFDQLVQYALDHENCDIPEDYQISKNSGNDDDHNNNNDENFKLGEWFQQERSKMENYFYYDYEKYYLLHNVFFPGVEIEKPEDFERLRNKDTTTTAQTSSSSSSLPSRGGRGKVVTTTTRDKINETSSVQKSLSEPKRKLTANKAPQRKSGGAVTTTQSSSLPMKQKENMPPQARAEPKESSTVSSHLKNVTKRAEKHSYEKNHEETSEIDDKEEEYPDQEENSDEEEEIILEDGEVEEEEEEDEDYDDDVEIVVNKVSKRNNKTNSTSNNAANTAVTDKRRKLSHNPDASNQSLTSNNFCLYEYKRKGESFLGLGKKITPSPPNNGEITSSSNDAPEFFEFRIFFPLTAKNPLSSKFEELEKTNVKIPRESIHQDSLAFNKG
jgi:hypothetical protein